MSDLYLGLAIVGAVSLACFVMTLWLSHTAPRFVADLVAVIVVVAMFLYIRHVWQNVLLVSWLPYSNLIVLGNWFPPAAGVLAGLAWRRIPGRYIRKSLSVAALASVAGYSAVAPLLGEAPRCLNVWEADTCVQTTEMTCTPACAATLLRSYGIAATEQEMADLCLTREGTTWLGLYRGMKLKTQGTGLVVDVVQCEAEDVFDLDAPAILNVGLAADAGERKEEFVTEWGWKPGVGHSVILMRSDGTNTLQIADPTPGYGYEHWTKSDLRMLFRGTALRLIDRS